MSLVLVGLVAMTVVLAFTRTGPWPAVIAASFISTRVGGASLDMSIADVALVAASLVAAPQLGRITPHTRTALAIGSAYLALLAVSVFATPEPAAILEWMHRVFLVLGAIAVGAAIARRTRIRSALRALFLTASVLAVAAIVESISTGFEPAYVFGFHKNWTGPLLAMSALVLQACWRQAGLGLLATQSLWVLLAAGLLATQSRASVVGLAAAMLVGAARTRQGRWKLALLAPVAVGLMAFAIQSIRIDTTGVNDNQFNTVRTREAVYRAALHEYHNHPFFGAGVRWFAYPGRPLAEPHSALFATLSESGLVGLLAVTVLFGGALLLVRRIPGPLGAAALSLLVFRLVEGQFAIFWVAGVMTLPWIVVGMATADTDQQPTAEPPTTRRSRPRLVGAGSNTDSNPVRR